LGRKKVNEAKYHLKRGERWRKKDFSPDIWEYPTGRMHQFETPEEGLRREILEETGLEIDIVKLINTFHIFRGEKLLKINWWGLCIGVKQTMSR
jgi:8-oxo-dGTP pyrophosphatase MutT (NUDIX family)